MIVQNKDPIVPHAGDFRVPAADGRHDGNSSPSAGKKKQNTARQTKENSGRGDRARPGHSSSVLTKP